MKISNITITNFKKIKFAALQLDDWNEIIGENGAGKTSFADAVRATLEWAGFKRDHVNVKNLGSEVVTDEERNGSVTLTINGDGVDYVVERKFYKSSGKTEISVRRSDNGDLGDTFQAFLDKITGGKIVRPGEFSFLKPKEQVRRLLKAYGLEDKMIEIENRRSQLYSQRTLVGHDRDRAKKILPDTPPKKVERVDVGKLSEERDRLKDSQQEYESLLNEKKRYNEEVAELKQKLSMLETSVSRVEDNLRRMDYPDTTDIDEKLASANSTNEAAAVWDSWVRNQKEYQNKAAEYEEYTRKINDCDDEKASLLEDVDLDIPDLTFDEDCIRLNTRPLQLCSRSQVLELEAEIVFRELPKDGLRFIQFVEFAFSQNTKDRLRAKAKEADVQFWVEDDQTRTENGDGALVIEVEDGEVK